MLVAEAADTCMRSAISEVVTAPSPDFSASGLLESLYIAFR